MDFFKVFFPLFFVGRVIYAIIFCVAMILAIGIGFLVASIAYLAGFNEAGDKVNDYFDKINNA